MFVAQDAQRRRGEHEEAGLVGRQAQPARRQDPQKVAVTEQKDARALDAVTALAGAELLKRCKTEHISMCGRGPAAVVLAAARALGAARGEVVDYRHSGWVSSDQARVVGYAGVVIA